jgi:tetratricopeptide (TPR) repeat protein
MSGMGKHQEALDLVNRVIDLLEAELRENSLSDSQQRVALPNTYFIRGGHLMELGRHKEAVDAFDRALTANLGPPSELPCRLFRAVSLARIDDHSRAAAAAATLAAGPSVEPSNLAALAVVYALCRAAVHKDSALPAAERDRLAEQYAKQALALLAQANAAGLFKNQEQLKQLKNDPDLESLRSLDKFKELLQDVEKQSQPAAK